MARDIEEVKYVVFETVQSLDRCAWDLRKIDDHVPCAMGLCTGIHLFTDLPLALHWKDQARGFSRSHRVQTVPMATKFIPALHREETHRL